MRKIWTGLMLSLMISACDKKSEEANPPTVGLRQAVENSLQQFAKNKVERDWIRGRWQDELDYGRLVDLPQGGWLVPWRSKKHERDTVSWAGLFCLPTGSARTINPVVMEYYGRDEHIDCHSMQLAMKSEAGAADGKYRLLRPDGKLIVELNYEKGALSTLKKLERRLPATQGRAAQRQAKCLQWFLITTHYNIDGTVDVYEDYLGTTCEGCDYYDFLNQLTGCSSSESGAGGSGSDSECAERQEMQSFSTSEALPAVMRPITMKEREVDCSWIFYRNTFNIWYFKSLETGRQYQLYKKWYWSSFKHVGVLQQGYAFGVSISCEVLSVRTSFNEDIAASELNFKITKSVLCKEFPITFWDTGVESAQFYASAL